jgi:hypothetical protein
MTADLLKPDQAHNALCSLMLPAGKTTRRERPCQTRRV